MRKLLIILSILILSQTVTAEESNRYFSFKGKYYIDYPADWKQISYNTVDIFLVRSKAGSHLFDYDAVFAPQTSEPFISADYVIVTVDKIGEPTQLVIDSVLDDVKTTFGSDIHYFPVGDFMTNVTSGAPSYDKDEKLITVINRLQKSSGGERIGLIMMKFYEYGVVNFYFYTYAETLEESKNVFDRIVASLNTENFDELLPKEEIKVADIDTDKKESDDNDYNHLYYSVPFLLLLVIIIRRNIRKKKAKKGQ